MLFLIYFHRPFYTYLYIYAMAVNKFFFHSTRHLSLPILLNLFFTKATHLFFNHLFYEVFFTHFMIFDNFYTRVMLNRLWEHVHSKFIAALIVNV